MYSKPVAKSMYLILIPAYLSVIILLAGVLREVFFYSRTNEVVVYEKRFSKLKQFVLEESAVGYTTDTGNIKDFYLVQYVLAPIILNKNLKSKQNLVVGNYLKNDTAPFTPLIGYTIINDFGSGVILLSLKNQ